MLETGVLLFYIKKQLAIFGLALNNVQKNKKQQGDCRRSKRRAVCTPIEGARSLQRLVHKTRTRAFARARPARSPPALGMRELNIRNDISRPGAGAAAIGIGVGVGVVAVR